MKMNERKKKLTGLLAIALVIFVTVISSVPVNAKNGVSSTGNILLDNDDMALYASDINYLETEKNTLFSELPLLPDKLTFDGSRNKNIKSKGVIDYAGGKVVIDASDFMYLANEIDALEAAYKINTVTALNYMGTYYKEDGSVTHDKSEESLPVEYAANLSFEEIYEGVLQSQSVENLAITEDVTGASADNLSTGTAAWLDGELVVGNGADNDASYKEGYSDGKNEGYNLGYTAGRTQGQNDVKANPSAYGISTNVKVFNMIAQGECNYITPVDGTYHIKVMYSWNNTREHTNVSSLVRITADKNYDYLNFHYKNNNWVDDSDLSNGDVIIVTLPAGSTVTLNVDGNYNNSTHCSAAWIIW